MTATATVSGGDGGRVRVFLAQCAQETGSFLPQRSTVGWFEQHILTEGDGLLRVAAGRRLELAGALDAARAHGAEVAPGLAAWAMPWGILERGHVHHPPRPIAVQSGGRAADGTGGRRCAGAARCDAGGRD